jgi:hypothetical protein
VERALGKVRFARLIHSGARVLGGPAVRAACGGSLSLSWLPPRVVRTGTALPLGGVGSCDAGSVRTAATAQAIVTGAHV